MKRLSFFKRIVSLPIIFIAVIVLLLVASGPINDIIAANIVKGLTQNPLPEKTEIIEEKAVAARMCGNGDGVQYFGALLLKSDLTLDELRAYYSQFSDSDDCNVVDHQYGKDIKQNELPALQTVSFNKDIDDDNYYILYTWGNYNGIFKYLDIRGIN